MRKTLNRLAIATSLTLSLGASTCAMQPGDFCAVYSSPILFPAEVSQVVVAGARPEAVKIKTRNDYFDGHCR